MKNTHFIILFITFLTFAQFSVPGLAAQEIPDSLTVLLARADSLHRRYEFEKALEVYEIAYDIQPDSVARLDIEDKMLTSENALNLLSYVKEPKVVAKQRFHLKDFFLFYPLQDASWRNVPNQLDSVNVNPLVMAMYVPDNASRLFFSATDESRARNIYMTEYQDSVWTAPTLLNEHLTSSADEIYPMLSPDGKSLYFASSGLFGVGGYDLFVSHWNEETRDWDTPENLGFPYSSPYDDFLFLNTDDGRYSIFASNRECPASDSVYLYVLEYDSMPVGKRMDAEKVRELSLLKPLEDAAMMNNDSAVGNQVEESIDTKKYMAKMSEVRALRDSIYHYSKSIDEQRALFAASDDDEQRMKLTVDILRKESLLPALQDSLNRATAAIQKIEMEFLFKGVVIDPEKMAAQADREVVGASTNYAFARQNPGKALNLSIAAPVVEFDYSFRILDEAQFAENQKLPAGLTYQIQILGQSSRITDIKRLKGLSPVYEEKLAGGKYCYRVGLFSSYADVLGNLNKVKKLGFRSAFITAFNSGVPLSVSKARSLEKALSEVKWKLVLESEADSLPDEIMALLKSLQDKDIAKSSEEQGTLFTVTAFDTYEEAQQALSMIKEAGFANVSLSRIGTDM